MVHTVRDPRYGEDASIAAWVPMMVAAILTVRMPLAFAAGFASNPDHRENCTRFAAWSSTDPRVIPVLTLGAMHISSGHADTVHAEGPRVPADEIEGLDGEFDGNYVNPEDARNGTLARSIEALYGPS